MTPDWSPFLICPAGERALAPRGLESPAGVGDRLRTAAFAELQAREAFRWAAGRYAGSPEALRSAWLELAVAEERHLGWLLKRMEELGQGVKERRVSAALWASLTACPTAKEFSLFMAAAEERGRLAGERFRDGLSAFDPASADIFGRIAEEEVAHIALAGRHFPGEGHGSMPPRSDGLGSSRPTT